MKSGGQALLMWALVAVCLFAASPADAHTRRRSYSSWSWEGANATVVFRFDERSIAELIFGPGLERGAMTRTSFERMARLPPELLARGMTVTQGSEACSLSLVDPVAPRQGSWFVVRGQFDCPSPVHEAGVLVRSSLLPGSSLDHVHFMRWRILDDGEVADEGHSALGMGNRDFEYAADGGGQVRQTFGAMVAQGVIHVVFGYDHVAFLATLILVSWFLRRRTPQVLSELLRLALGFTLGHSLTLGLAATGAVQVAEATVEFLIALSVAGLAFEGLLRGRPGDRTLRTIGVAALVAIGLGSLLGGIDHSPLAVIGTAVFLAAYAWIHDPGPGARATVATVFGLVHGFGFAGALSELNVEGTGLVRSLLAFNIGVELGQWILVAVGLGGLTLLVPESSRRRVFEWGCGITLWLGLFWMAQRAW